MKNKITFSVLALLISINFSYAQNWAEMKSNPNANFYDIKNAFDEYWKDKNIDEPGKGYKAFKRWEYFVEQRVYPSGNLSLLNLTTKNYEAFLKSNAPSAQRVINSANMIASTTWTAVGPMGAMTGSANNGLPRKAGRDNFVTFHPTNLNTFWVGAPAGGVWETTNNGASWTILNSSLSHIGCTDLVVDPTNTNVMYLATGDGYAGDTPSFGIFKSTNAGASWAATGLTFNINANVTIRKIIIHPTSTQTLLAATSNGIYRTVNGGTNWTQINTVNTYDLEFKPGDPNTVYASGASFYLSTNGGVTFSIISNGITTSGAVRKNIAVTPADPTVVYCVSALSSNFGLQGVYKSVNSGVSFTLMASTPDLLANNCTGTGTGGQGWYDLAIAVSPLNADEVMVGGINHWRSTNGGTNWTNIGCWNSTSANPPYVHADVHDIDYRSDGVIYSANDGGIYFYTGSAWTDITANRNIAQIYRIGCSSLSPNRWITGHQDNGSNLYTGLAYQAKLAGDGMDCQIDRTNDNYLIATNPNGNHAYSSNAGTSWSYSTFSPAQNGAWVTPIKQDPTVATRYYSGRTQLYVSNNSAVSFSALPATGGSGSIVEFAIAPSNNQIIYVLHSGSIRKTIDGGTTWTNVTGTVPVGSGAPTYICVKPTDPNTAWVTLTGYSAGNKVFKTTNGGTSWTNVSTNLPNIPNNCIVYEPGTSDRVYVGMDVGVYYLDNSNANWTLYNIGLPNTVISELEISPAAPTKLRAATYGRGVYEVDVVPSSLPPVSNFTNGASACINQPVTFNDQSSNTPTTWSWSVTPTATINTNTSQNPQFVFGAVGVYTISMQANNGNGLGNVVTKTVQVSSFQNVVITNSVQTICSGSSATITASGATSYSWNTGATSAQIVVSPLNNTNYIVTNNNGGCITTKTAVITVNQLPTLNLTAVNNTICAGEIAQLGASGSASTFTWQPGNLNGANVSGSPSLTTTYSCEGTSAAGCKNTSTVEIVVLNCTSINANNGLTNGLLEIYPNPVSDNLTIKNKSVETKQVEIKCFDIQGKLVLSKTTTLEKNSEHVIIVSTLSKGKYILVVFQNEKEISKGSFLKN